MGSAHSRTESVSAALSCGAGPARNDIDSMQRILLAYNGALLLDAEYMHDLYAQALQYGVLRRYDEPMQQKRAAVDAELRMTDDVLRTLAATSGEMQRFSKIVKRRGKFLRRKLGLLAANRDPHQDVLHARCHIVCAAAMARLRLSPPMPPSTWAQMRQREATMLKIKRSFLLRLLGMAPADPDFPDPDPDPNVSPAPTECQPSAAQGEELQAVELDASPSQRVPVDAELLEMILALAGSLPDRLYGVCGFSGIGDGDVVISDSSQARPHDPALLRSLISEQVIRVLGRAAQQADSESSELRTGSEPAANVSITASDAARSIQASIEDLARGFGVPPAPPLPPQNPELVDADEMQQDSNAPDAEIFLEEEEEEEEKDDNEEEDENSYLDEEEANESNRDLYSDDDGRMEDEDYVEDQDSGDDVEDQSFVVLGHLPRGGHEASFISRWSCGGPLAAQGLHLPRTAQDSGFRGFFAPLVRGQELRRSGDDNDKQNEEDREVPKDGMTAAKFTDLIRLFEILLVADWNACERRRNAVERLLGWIQRYIFCSACEALVSAEQTGDFLVVVFNYISKTLQHTERSADALNRLSNSWLRSIVPEALAGAMCLCTTEDFVAASEKAIAPLQLALVALDDFINVVRADDDAGVVDGITLPASNSIFVESQHTYARNCTSERTVVFAGASHLVLKFDSRCSTERGRDLLQLRNSEGAPVCGVLSGPPHAWPKEPLVVAGDRISFEFRAESQQQSQWGYRCLVTALNLGPIEPPQDRPFQWLVDVQKSLSQLLGVVLKALACGRTPTSSESSTSKWLTSPLFRSGVESGAELNVNALPKSLGSFLESLIAGDKTHLAVRFHSKLLAGLPFHGSDLLGGSIVDRTIRLFLVVLLRHLGLADAVAAVAKGWEDSHEAAPRSDLVEPLLGAWDMCKKMRQWIVSERQRAQLEFAERSGRLKEEGRSEIEIAEILKEEEKSLTYASICELLNERCMFLLQARPSHWMKFLTNANSLDVSSLDSSTSSKLMLSLSVSEMRRLARINSSETQQQRNIELWKSVFRTWNTLSDWMSHRREHGSDSKETSRDEQDGDSGHSLADLLVMFIQSPIPLSVFRKHLDAQQQRAKNRLCAISTFNEMMSRLRSATARLGLLQMWGCPFRVHSPFKGWPAVGHWRSSIESCGPQLEARIQKVYSDMFVHLVSLLGGNGASCSTSVHEGAGVRELALNALSCEVRSCDHQMLLDCGVVPLLCALEKKSSSNDTAASVAFNLFALSLCSFREKHMPSPADSATENAAIILPERKLQAQVASHVWDQVDASLHSLSNITSEAHLLKETGGESERVFDRYIMVEQFVFDHLSLLASLSYSPSPLTEESRLPLLSLAYAIGSPRLQKLVVSLWRSVLPLYDCNDRRLRLDWEKDTLPLDFLWQEIGSMLVFEYDSVNKRKEEKRRHAIFQSPSNCSAFDVRVGTCVRDLTLDLVSLLRMLVQYARWRPAIQERLNASLRRIPDLVSREGRVDDRSAVPECLAALSICCGHSDRIRVNARVQSAFATVTGENEALAESGEVVALDRASGRAQVLFDGNNKRVVNVHLSKLRAVGDVCEGELLDPTLFFAAVSAVCLPPPPPTAVTVARRKRRRQRLARQSKSYRSHLSSSSRGSSGDVPMQEQWACFSCTFENAYSNDACEICFAPKPAFLVSEAEQAAAAAADNAQGDEPMMDESSDDEDDVPDTRPEPDRAELRFVQLRSAMLKSFCVVMQHKPWPERLLHSQALHSLLQVAVATTELDEFRSAEQLEEVEDRVLELLFEAERNILPASVSLRRKPQAELLQHSPFRFKHVLLPSCLDIGSSRNVTFLDENSCIVRSISHDSGSAGAVVRSNFAIPNSLPAFYFEAKVLSEGVVLPVSSHEMTLEPADATSESLVTAESVSGWRFGIGLYRSGLEMSSVPGHGSSFAFVGTGHFLCTRGGLIASTPIKTAFSASDVVGCGWDIRRKTVFFTVNGAIVGSGKAAFEGVDGQFCACAWIENCGAEIEFNYGQNPFVFNFADMLPSDYVVESSGASTAVASVTLSDVELRRQTAAEDLAMIMQGFPKEICVVALESSNDNMQVALNWLLENGYREMERMAEDAIRRSASFSTSTVRHRTPRPPVAVFTSDDTGSDVDETGDLIQWFSSEGRRSGHRERAGNTVSLQYLDDEVEEEAPLELGDASDQEQVPAASSRVVSARRSLLDPPANLRHRSNAEVVESAVLSEFDPGSVLRIAEHACQICSEEQVPGLRKAEGRTAVVSHVDINKQEVRLQWYEPETAVRFLRSVPVVCLHRPRKPWQDPCAALSGCQWRELALHYRDTELASSVLKVRRAMIALIGDWPHSIPFETQRLGGGELVMELLKLSAAEYLASGKTKNKYLQGAQGANTPMMVFRQRFAFLLRQLTETLLSSSPDDDGKETFAEALRIKPCHYLRANDQSEAESRQEKMQDSDDDDATEDDGAYHDVLTRVDLSAPAPMHQLLVEQAIVHFVQAVENPVPVRIVETDTHLPYPSHCDVRQRIHIAGASRLLVEFDSRCHTSTDMLTRLSFYRDQDYSDQISTFRGRGLDKWQSFVVDSNKLFFKFSSSADSNYWGFKFTVKPLDWRLDDVQAKRGLNLELGVWIVDLLLSVLPDFLLRQFLNPIYQAIVFFVDAVKHANKLRGVELLNRLLLQIQRLRPVSTPDFGPLRVLANSLDQVMFSIDADGRTPSPVLQAIVELLATVELVSQSLSPTEPLSLPAPSSIETTGKSSARYELRHLYERKLVVLDAVYGVLDSNDSSLQRSVTQAVQALVRSLGGSLLLLPPLLSRVPFLSVDHDPEPLKSVSQEQKRLRIRFAIETSAWSAEQGMQVQMSKEFSRQFEQQAPWHAHGSSRTGKRPSVVRAAPSWFDRIVSLSRMTLDVSHSHLLPADILLESVIVDTYSQTFLPVLDGPVTLRDEFDDSLCAVPDPVGAFTQFSLVFWVFVDTNLSEVAECSGPLVNKGCKASSLYPSIRLAAGVVHVHLYTQFGRVTLMASSTLPASRWAHVCVTSDGVQATLFIDGKECARSNLLAPAAVNCDPIFVGVPPPDVVVSNDESGVVGLSQSSSTPVSFRNAVDIASVRLYYRCLALEQVQDVLRELRPNWSSTKENAELSERVWHLSPTTLIAYEHDELLGVLKALNETQWSSELDRAVMDVVQQLHERWLKQRGHGVQHVKLMDAQPHCFDAKQGGCIDLSEIIREHVPLVALFEKHGSAASLLVQRRFFAIRALNQRVDAVLKVPIIDFSQAADEWSLASRLSSLRELIFMEVKMKPWERVLRETETGGLQHITINRPRALRAKNKGDPEGCKSIFGQIYRQLHFLRPAVLRCRNRPWSVTYAGEGGQDAGGLFRDSISELCSDIHSSYLPLFIKCPNARGFGDNQEKLIPNPSSSSLLHLSMFSFVGKMMGVAIRGGHVLNLDLPSIVWKPLVGQELTREDLQAIDSLCFDVLEKVSNIETENVTEETFRDFIPYSFTTVSSDGRVVELREGGAEQDVTWHNRFEFVELVEKYRLEEFSLQLKALQKGLATIVPVQLLRSLFTFDELELMAVGKREIDIDHLRNNTRYKPGVKSDDPHVLMLWEVLEEFTHQQRQMFLRFVWGQSRLPFNSDDFNEKFSIQSSLNNSDETLPISHTCFFSLELPRYSNKEILRKKLLYAMYECIAIDLDHAADNVNWDDE